MPMIRRTVVEWALVVLLLLNSHSLFVSSSFVSSSSHLQQKSSTQFRTTASSCHHPPIINGNCNHATATAYAKKSSLSFSSLVGHRISYRGRSKTVTASFLSPQEIIETCVSVDTFAPQFLWLLIIAAPSSKLTKKIMGPITPILALSTVHLLTVLLAASQEGALSQVLVFKEVFDPSMSQLGGMQKMFTFPNFVAEEWPHVLVWDLFVGRAIWLDGLQRDIDTKLALSFCNFIGPPGLLIHVGNCLLSGKGLPPLGYTGEEETET